MSRKNGKSSDAIVVIASREGGRKRGVDGEGGGEGGERGVDGEGREWKKGGEGSIVTRMKGHV